MDNKYLNLFTDVFNALNDAGSVLWVEFIEDKSQEDDIIFSSHIERYPQNVQDAIWCNIELCLSLLEEFDIKELDEEIAQNLYLFRECPNIYLISIFRKFRDIVQYFGIHDKNRTYGKHITACTNFIKSWDYDSYTNDAEKYVLECRWAVFNFFEMLDAKCLDYNLDIMRIQEEAGVIVYTRGNAASCSLYTNGYKKKLDEIWGTSDKRHVDTNQHTGAASHTNEPPTKAEYRKELIKLFHGNVHLLSELVGKSDNEIASLISKWAGMKDNRGKPLIENPKNNLKSKFAHELKHAGFMKCTENTFRAKL